MGGGLTIKPGSTTGLFGAFGSTITIASGDATSEGITGTVTANAVTISGGSASGGSTTIAGGVVIDGGVATGSSPTNGSVSIGTSNAEAVSIGRSGKTTTINGDLTVVESLSAATPSFTGPTTVTGSLIVNGSTVPTITVSSEAPSGGVDGDVWLVQY